MMTAQEFRRLALGLPEVSEQSHMKHPDFRVQGKIFATLGPGEKWGMVKLTPEQQEAVTRAHPAVFQAFDGAWGRRGATKVTFDAAVKSIVRPALVMAWRNTAPKRLSQQFENE
jgi:hypothetical protein